MKLCKRLLACLAAALLLLPAAACNPDQEAVLPQDPPEATTPETPVTPEVPEKPAQKPETPEPVYELAFEKADYVLALTENAGTMSAVATLKKDGAAMEGTIEYTIADAAVATCAEGVLHAASAGRTTISAACTADGKTFTATATVTVLAETTAEKVNALEDVSLFGRTYLSAKRLVLDNVCTGLEVAFCGTELSCKFSTKNGRIRYFIDGDTEGTAVVKPSGTLKIDGLADGVHVVRILKASSPIYNEIRLAADPLSTDGIFLTPPPKSDLKIEFLGDSITAGCGALGKASEKQQTIENSDPTKAYAYLTAQQLGADFSVIALEGMCVKDTATCGYEKYLTKSVNSSTAYDGPYDADVVVLALAENDMWHATSNDFPNYTVEKFAEDYKAMLARIREKNPEAFIVCIFGMMPASHTTLSQKTIEGAIADMGDSKISSLSMLCNETGANSHPNAKSHKTNAEKLAAHIRTLIP